MTSLYKEAGSRALALLDTVAGSYEEILGKNLVGIYAHGSLAFGCFSWERSDIDFLVVAKSALALNEKVALLDVLTRLEDKAPARGFEMSVVSEKDCRDFVYPTPFDLHFSALHREKYKIAPQAYCSAMHGTDKDLAAHFTVTKAVGKTIRGRSVSSVFGDVPRADYIDSLLTDISDSPKKTEAFGYAVLSLCRTLAFFAGRSDRFQVGRRALGLKKSSERICSCRGGRARRIYLRHSLFHPRGGSGKIFPRYARAASELKSRNRPKDREANRPKRLRRERRGNLLKERI